MSFLYKTLYFKGNSDAEYQYRGNGNWYKRKKGSKEDWYKVNADQTKNLESYFKDSGRFYNYSTIAKVGGILVLLSAAIVVYKVGSKKR